MFDELQQDVKFAIRALIGAKGFSLSVVLVLAIGIAATTIVFALVNGIVLRPLPVRDQDELIVAWRQLPSGFDHYPFGDAEIKTVARESRLFEAVAGVTSNGVGRMVLVDGGVPAYARVALVTERFFEVLGVSPIAGRVFGPLDASASERVLVLSYGYWMRRYGGDRAVIGRQVRLDGDAFTLVGIMPQGFDYPTSADVWRTTNSVRTDGPFGDSARREVDLVARVRSGVSRAQATAELAALNQRLEVAAPPGQPRGLLPVARPLDDVIVGDVRSQLWILFGAVTLVLAVACTNVANLFLMRGQARMTELALRAGLGAGHGRMLRQLVLETAVLAALGGALGLMLAAWTLPGVVRAIPEALPKLESVAIDRWVVLLVVALTFLVVLSAGLAPALTTMRSDVMAYLRQGPRKYVRSPRLARRALVVAQIALAVVTVAAAILLGRSLLQLQQVDTGMRGERLVFVELGLPPLKYARRTQHEALLDNLIAGFGSRPSVLAATPINIEPFAEAGWDVPTFTAEGQNVQQARANPALNLESIFPSYFHTFGIPVVKGRAFQDADRGGAQLVAIVSADLAQRVWGGRSAIGKRIKMGEPHATGQWYTIVGVAAATRYRDLTNPRPTLYLPARQFQMTASILAVRTVDGTGLPMSLAREVVRSADPDVLVVRSVPFEKLAAALLLRPRFNAWLVTCFGVVTLLVGSVGLYAVVAYSVKQRVRELAIRISLGATPRRVLREILSDAAMMLGPGIAIGLACAVLSARLLRGLVFGIAPLDPISLIASMVLLVAAGLIATAWPALTAATTNPIIALRAE